MSVMAASDEASVREPLDVRTCSSCRDSVLKRPVNGANRDMGGLLGETCEQLG